MTTPAPSPLEVGYALQNTARITEEAKAYVIKAVSAYALVGELVEALDAYHVHQKTRGDGSVCFVCELVTRAREVMK